MTVYKRSDGSTYSYDFQLNGKRYSGVTDATCEDEARRVEASIRGSILNLSPFCRLIIKRAKRALPRTENARQGHIYMLQSRYFIKIGRTISPGERLKAIQTSSPDDCELLFTIPGDLRMETKLHAEFEACHYRGEWYFLCGKLKSFVEAFDAAKTELKS